MKQAHGMCENLSVFRPPHAHHGVTPTLLLCGVCLAPAALRCRSFFQIHGPHKEISPLRPASTTELN